MDSVDEKSLDELVSLIKGLPTSHPLVAITAKSLATSTCANDILAVVGKHRGIVSHFSSLLPFEEPAPATIVLFDAILDLLVNLSAIPLPDSKAVVNRVCDQVKKLAEKETWNFALMDKCFAILSNLTAEENNAAEAFKNFGDSSLFTHIIRFDQANRNPSEPHLVFFPSFLVNLSRLDSFRSFLLNKQNPVIQRLVPFMDMKFPATIRGAVMRLVRNCCFDSDVHPFLLGEDVGLLPHLLLPIAGPEEFDEEDTNKLPIDLQFLPEDKLREPHPEFRNIILECLFQLCATRFGREFLRNHGAYLIIRELHKWEKDESVSETCFKVVSPLINDEPAEEHQNLKAVVLPENFNPE